MKPEWKLFANFAAVGLACTAAYALLFAGLRQFTGAPAANLLALLITCCANFWANRRLTFAGRDGRLASQAARYLVAYLIALAASLLVFQALLALSGPHPVAFETAAGVGSGMIATTIRYGLMRSFVFPYTDRRRSPRLPGLQPIPPKANARKDAA